MITVKIWRHVDGEATYVGEYQFPAMPQQGDLVELDDFDGLVLTIVWTKIKGLDSFKPELHLE